MLIILLEVLIAAAFLCNGLLLVAGRDSFFLDPRYLEQVKDKGAFQKELGVSMLVLGMFWIIMCFADQLAWIPRQYFTPAYWTLLVLQVLNLVRIFRKHKK